jgi:hypothetical protein
VWCTCNYVALQQDDEAEKEVELKGTKAKKINDVSSSEKKT